MSFGLYVHIPYCQAKCPYCAFVSYPLGDAPLDPARYLEALLEEARSHLPEWSEGVASVYFGGGTPTALGPLLPRLIRGLWDLFRWDGVEVTVEANPGTVDERSLTALLEAGVNRLSLGFQSLDDRLLQTLGRVHDRAGALEAFCLARGAGFANINLDLIFNIPGQTLSSWKATLEEVVELAPEHVSCYALEIEEGTPFEAYRDETCDDRAAEMYHLAREILREAGYEHYEISNFAREGRACAHNIIYWESEAYLGLGAGAHSHRPLGPQAARWHNPPDLNDYAQSPGVAAGRTELSVEECVAETVFMGLRLIRGIDLVRFRERFGWPIERFYAEELEHLVSQGLLAYGEGRLRLTERALAVANQVFVRLLEPRRPSAEGG